MELFYIKHSLGINESQINILKFRTMEIGADSLEEKIRIEELDGLGKVIEDSRITFVGKLLRKYWIDELPQLYNLAKGEIKLVGIRPMGNRMWNFYPSEIKRRALKQKPGLLGVNYAYPYTDNFEKLVEQMKTYLDEWELNTSETDFKYLRMILKNILLDGVRSR